MAFNGPPNPGYAQSNISAPPPGLSVAGGQQPNYNPNAQYGTLPRGNQGGGDGCCAGGCAGCLGRNNPFEKANTITDDIFFNARYKRAMGISIGSMIATFVGAILVSGAGCIYINYAPVLYLFPIFMPSCNRKMLPFYWACLSIGSVIMGFVSLFISLVTGCAQEGAIIMGVTAVFELALLYTLYRMDPDIKAKVRYCFASCGCLGEKAQMETMVVHDNQYATSTPSPSPHPNTPYNNGGYGYDGASQPGGTLGPGSYVGGPNNFPTPPASVNGGSYASHPVAPPTKPVVYNGRNSAGKGSLIIDSPEFEGSNAGY